MTGIQFLAQHLAQYMPQPQAALMGEVAAGDLTTGAFIAGVEQVAPLAPAANGYRVWAQDNGAGKTQYMIAFATGGALQLAIEP